MRICKGASHPHLPGCQNYHVLQWHPASGRQILMPDIVLCPGCRKESVRQSSTALRCIYLVRHA